MADPRNWRKHPKAQQTALRTVLAEIGYADALLARETPTGLMLIDGHLRAETTPDQAVPVLVLDVDEIEAGKILATLDPLAGMAERDQVAAADLVEMLKAHSSDAMNALMRSAVGFRTEAEQDKPPASDAIPGLIKKWGTELGQLWRIGDHRLCCGDSTSHADVTRLFAARRPDMMVTDPPYGVNYDPEWRAKGTIPLGAHNLGKVSNDDRVDWSKAWELAGCGVAYVWHSALHTSEVAKSLVETGYGLRAQIIWAKAHFVMSRGHYHWGHEPCWYGVRAGAKAAWVGDRSQSTIWEISGLGMMGGNRKGTDAPTGHSTQKPVECMSRPMRNHDLKVIYDPFTGSGTTLVAAQQLGRVALGMELDPGYVAATLERLAAFELKPELVKET